MSGRSAFLAVRIDGTDNDDFLLMQLFNMSPAV